MATSLSWSSTCRGDGGFRSPLRTACVVVHQSDGKGLKAASDGGWLLAWGVALWEVFFASAKRLRGAVWRVGDVLPGTAESASGAASGTVSR